MFTGNGNNKELTNQGKIWNIAFTCIFITNVLLGLSQFVVNPLVATYTDYLGASEVMVGLIAGLYFGVAFAARPIAGPTIIKLNKKNIMILANILGIFVNIGYALAGGIPQFVVVRILHGIQFAFIGSLTYTLAADNLPQEKMASGLGFLGAGLATAIAIGPGIGIGLRSWGETTFGSFEAGYTVVFLVAAVFMLLTLIPTLIMPYQHRSKEELAHLGAWYKNIFAPEALMPAVVLTLYSVAQILYQIYMEPFATANNIPSIGLFFTVYAFILLISHPISGRLVDTYGIPRVLIPGTLIFAVSFILVGLANSLFTLLIAAVVAAIGFGTAQPSIQVMSIQSVSPARRGVAANTNFFGIDLGFFIGPTLGGAAYSVSGSYSSMFLLGIIPVLMAFVIFILNLKSFKKSAHILGSDLEL